MNGHRSGFAVLGARLVTIEVETGDSQFCLRLTAIKIPRNLCGEHELVKCSQPCHAKLPVGTEG